MEGESSRLTPIGVQGIESDKQTVSEQILAKVQVEPLGLHCDLELFAIPKPMSNGTNKLTTFVEFTILIQMGFLALTPTVLKGLFAEINCKKPYKERITRGTFPRALMPGSRPPPDQ